MSRFNIYAEEMTEDVRIVEKVAEDTGNKFYGVRLFLESPDVLHHTDDDDDRSAVTLFVPWTKAGGHDTQKVRRILTSMLSHLSVIEGRVKVDGGRVPGDLGTSPHLDGG